MADLPGIVVDDNDVTAIGERKVSQFTPHYVGTGYRHDLNADKGRKTLTFTLKLPASGRYEVRMAYPAFTNRAKHVPVHVFHADGEETIFVDETQDPPIDGWFISLGRFRFEKDGAGYVLISNEGTEGTVCADAVQFLPEAEADRLAAPARSVAEPKADPETALQARVERPRGRIQKLAGSNGLESPHGDGCP